MYPKQLITDLFNIDLFNHTAFFLCTHTVNILGECKWTNIIDVNNL